ncbi:MAG: TlpA family protein disulfide reductase [Nitrospinae bacterium]|nr:TlpA family protein disulfide reductase [Nitrospinota bacterium]
MSRFGRNTRRLFLYAAVLAVGYLAGIAAYPESTVEAASNEMAPELILHKLGGGDVKLSDYRGKWVFLNFWATWCVPCLQEMPSMESFHKKFKDKNMTMLAVSLDHGDATRVADFVKKKGITFEVFHDPESEASQKFGVYSLPSTFIINPRGVVVAQALGGREWTDPLIIDYFTGLMKKN